METGIDLSDPIVFARQLFGVELYRKQVEILRSLTSGRRIALAGGHGVGKTFLAALAAIWFGLRYKDSRVIILAPGWLTVRAVIWAEIHALLNRARLKLPAEAINRTEIRLGPHNIILGLSTSDSVRLQGHHSEHILLIIDEAPGLNADFWPSIEGILASGDSRIMMLGNPTITSGPFYDAFGRNRAAWSTFTASVFDTPNLDGLTPEALMALPDGELDHNPWPMLAGRRWTYERRREWWNGSIENSPLWTSRVLGQFPRESSNALFPIAALEGARRRLPDSGGEVIVGIDVAGPGRDRTVAVATCGGQILEVGIFTESNATGPVIGFLRKFSGRLRLVRIDSAGLGYYFVEIVRNAGFPVEGINVATTSKEPERFANLKAQRYWHLRERFVRNEISGLDDDMLAELAAFSYLIDSHGRTVVADKEAARAALGRSPDLAEAMMLALGEPMHEPFRYYPVRTSSIFDGLVKEPRPQPGAVTCPSRFSRIKGTW